jgi:two-component system sensor histidine kinase UhpB
VSLRARVALLVLGLFVAAMLGAFAVSVREARNDVLEEIAYDKVLINRVLALAIGDANADPALTTTPDFPRRLTDFAEALHFDVEVAGKPDPRFQHSNHTVSDAPAWFVDLLNIDNETLLQDFGRIDGDRIVLRTDAFREINEGWRSAGTGFIRRVGFLLLLNISVYLILGWWLRPVEQILVGLNDVERGDLSRRIPMTGLPEFDQISDKINQLTTVLGAAKLENEQLQSESISDQEREKFRLAQELHDRLGQSISAIKAVAASIEIRSQTGMPELAASARHIEDISEAAYDAVKQLMAGLRPAVLDELGLARALQQLVDDWNERNENTFCRLRIDSDIDDLGEEQSINIYRIVEEALANVAQHAKASKVNIVVSGSEVVSLSIADDGVGFDPEKVKKGRGLWNMQDRVTLLQGRSQIVASVGNGVSMFLEFPRYPDQRTRRKK